MRREILTVPALVAGLSVLGPAFIALGDTLLPGLYRLHNHPDAEETPPGYGARFDELFNASDGHDVFTLDFDDIQSGAFMTINNDFTVARIFGQALGGRDTGLGYANDNYRGVYQFDFTYNLGVGLVPGDDDLWTSASNGVNFGILTAPASAGGAVINLVDEKSGDYSFRFGDESHDDGHRNFNGLSGWGWMSYVTVGGGSDHVTATDWIFTATYEIPAPGAALALGFGGLFMAASRRRRA